MSDEQKPVDFGALAKEALAETYNPRARRCWPWSHEWTMWETSADGREQNRRCIGCGRIQKNVLVKTCQHRWTTIERSKVWGSSREYPTGVVYIQKCDGCGKIQRTHIEP